MTETKQVQTFGRKKNATAVAHVTTGQGFIRVNGKPIQLLEPQSLRLKVLEPILLLGANKFKDLNIRIRVSGGVLTMGLIGLTGVTSLFHTRGIGPGRSVFPPCRATLARLF